MATDLKALLEQHHQAQRRLEEIEAIERHQDEIENLADTLSQVTGALNKTAADAENTAGNIDEVREHLENAFERLGQAHQGMKELVDKISSSAGEVSKGVAKFAKHTKAAGEVLGKLDENIKNIRELMDKAEGKPSEVLDAFNDYFQDVVDKLGPLIGRIPGFGAFLIVWMKAIEGIKGSAEVLQKEVEWRNKMSEELFGFKLYITIMTPSQNRRKEIEQLHKEIDELRDQIENHHDFTGDELDTPPEDSRTPEERRAEVDIKNAIKLCGGWKKEDELRWKVAYARQDLVRVWGKLQSAVGNILNIKEKILDAKEKVYDKQKLADAAKNDNLKPKNDLNDARQALDDLRREQARTEEHLERVEEEFEKHKEDYEEAFAQFKAFVDCINSKLGLYSPVADCDYLKRYYPHILNPKHYGLGKMPDPRFLLKSAAKAGSNLSKPAISRTAGDMGSALLKAKEWLVSYVKSVTDGVHAVAAGGGLSALLKNKQLLITAAGLLAAGVLVVAVVSSFIGGGKDSASALKKLDQDLQTAAYVLVNSGIDPVAVKAYLDNTTADKKGDFIHSIPDAKPGDPGTDVDITHHVRVGVTSEDIVAPSADGHFSAEVPLALVRQAKLGASCKVVSPCWVRSSQPPISSVAPKLVTAR